MQIFMNILFTSFLGQLNKLCQSSSLSSEMLGNKAADFPKEINLLNLKKFQIKEMKNVLNRFSTSVLAQ